MIIPPREGTSRDVTWVCLPPRRTFCSQPQSPLSTTWNKLISIVLAKILSRGRVSWGVRRQREEIYVLGCATINVIKITWKRELGCVLVLGLWCDKLNGSKIVIYWRGWFEFWTVFFCETFEQDVSNVVSIWGHKNVSNAPVLFVFICYNKVFFQSGEQKSFKR